MTDYLILSMVFIGPLIMAWAVLVWFPKPERNYESLLQKTKIKEEEYWALFEEAEKYFDTKE